MTPSISTPKLILLNIRSVYPTSTLTIIIPFLSKKQKGSGKFTLVSVLAELQVTA